MPTALPNSKVLLIGPGSVGAVYLYQLLQAGCEVTVVCRSTYSRVKNHGFKLSSLRFGNVSYKPTHTIRSTMECRGQHFDYVLACTKSLPDARPSLVDMLRPVLKNNQETAIVLTQNGIMIEDEFARAFPQNPVISGVVYLPAIQTEPGIIQYSEMLNLLELGTYPANAPESHKSAAKKFADLIIRGGGGAQVHDDIQVSRWTKLMMNAAWNPICALSTCSDGSFLLSSSLADELAWDVMMEVLALAEKLGIKEVSVKDAEAKMAIPRRRAKENTGREPSMLQDVRHGRPLEVEAILGNTIKLAQKHGVPMPRIKTLYALLKGRTQAQAAEERPAEERPAVHS